MKNKWSVKDLADICEVSKPTIQTAINELGLDYDEFVKNKQLFYVEKARKIAEYVKKDFDFSEIFGKNEKDEKDGNNESNTEDQDFAKSQKLEKISPNIEKNLEELERKLQELAKSQQEEIQFLRRQVETKDTQIQDQQDQIKNLMAKNDTLLVANLKLTKQLEIEEQKEDIEDTKEEKKGLFHRLFKKNK